MRIFIFFLFLDRESFKCLFLSNQNAVKLSLEFVYRSNCWREIQVEKLMQNSMKKNTGLSSIEDAIKAVQRGEFVIVMDNEDRENEGDLIMPADFATEQALAFMIRYCSGVICTAATPERIDELDLPLMVSNNTEAHRCKFTVSVDYKHGTSTGISALDRARTIHALADSKAKAADFNRPGHVFPLVAQNGGVIARAGHTEAAVDIARLAGCSPVGYLCEINDDLGRMMRRPELETFSAQHKLHMITISDLIRYRFCHEVLIEKSSVEEKIVTPFGEWKMVEFNSLVGQETYHALIFGDVSNRNDVVVHYVRPGIHGSIEAEWAKEYVSKQAERGILIYADDQDELIRVSGELMAKQSIFGMGVQIVKALGVSSMSVLSKQKPEFDLNGFGVQISSHTALKH